jgi:hypothetical protein
MQLLLLCLPLAPADVCCCWDASHSLPLAVPAANALNRLETSQRNPKLTTDYREVTVVCNTLQLAQNTLGLAQAADTELLLMHLG